MKDEKGGALIITLLTIVFLGLIGISLATLVVADSRLQVLNAGSRRAFYSAQSGLEYGIRYIMEYALSNSNLNPLTNYSENVSTGDGTNCTVEFDIVNSTTINVIATGYSQNYAKTLQKTINYIDVSNYAIYTKGTVTNVRTIPTGSIMQNATVMPVFDQDELRDLARPTQYFSGNLTINFPLVFTRDITYVEGNLTFGQFNWVNVGNFVAGGNVLLQASWLPLGFTLGTIYQPITGRTFTSQWQFLWRELDGGLITNGNIQGTSIPFLPFRFTVRHNRSRINNLMQHSVNGGPLVITGSQWSILN